jgi:hypothetical protein
MPDAVGDSGGQDGPFNEIASGATDCSGASRGGDWDGDAKSESLGGLPPLPLNNLLTPFIPYARCVAPGLLKHQVEEVGREEA